MRAIALASTLFVSGLPNPHLAQAATTFSIPSQVTIGKGETFQLNVKGTSSKPTFRSSNKKVVSVTKSGKIKGNKIGKATITAKINKKTKRCKVTVKAAPKKISFLVSGEEIDFTVDGHRIFLKNLPKEIPDPILGVTVLKMEFDRAPRQVFRSYYPQMHNGTDFSEGYHKW